MASIFNDQAFHALLGRELHGGMLKAAEPIVQKALQDAETAIRKQVAAMVVGMVESSYSLEREGRLLTIRVQLGKE